MINNNFSKNFNFTFFLYKKKIINFNNLFLLFISKNYFLTLIYFFNFFSFYKKNWFKTIWNYNFYNYNMKIFNFNYKSLIFLNNKSAYFNYLNFYLNSNLIVVNKNYKNLIFRNVISHFIIFMNFKFIFLFINFFKKFILFNFSFNYSIYTYLLNYHFKPINNFFIKKNYFLFSTLRIKKNLNLLQFNYNLI